MSQSRQDDRLCAFTRDALGERNWRARMGVVKARSSGSRRATGAQKDSTRSSRSQTEASRESRRDRDQTINTISWR